jgi:hypothetical protein
VDFVRGDATGLALPAHGAALRLAGEAFLTEAFRSFGSLSPNNRIVRITRCEPFSGGNSGQFGSCFSSFDRSVESAYSLRRVYGLSLRESWAVRDLSSTRSREIEFRS